MFGLDMSDADVFWLNVTNVGLGIVTIVCLVDARVWNLLSVVAATGKCLAGPAIPPWMTLSLASRWRLAGNRKAKPESRNELPLS